MPTRTAAWLVACTVAVGIAACATGSRFAGADSSQACEAARQGRAPFQGASLARGGEVYQAECASCHAISGTHRELAGPPLQGIVLRPIGSVESYRYSPALGGRSDRWTLQALDLYIEDPGWFLPETRMNYDGLHDAGARVDLIAYLSCGSG